MPVLSPAAEPEFPWDRHPTETEVAHAAFLAYRDQLPLERSLRRVGTTLGKSATLIAGWSSKHGWVARAAAWDRHLDRAKEAATIAAIGEMAERHIQLAIGMQTKALEKLIALDVSAMSVLDLDRFVRTATMVEREARGILTKRSEEAEEGDGRALDLDDHITELMTRRQQAIEAQSTDMTELPPAEEA